MDIQIRKDLIQFCQKNHLASDLFPLDDVLIEPRMFSLPVQNDPKRVIQFDEQSYAFIPILPDFPEFASIYQYPDFHLIDTLTNPINLVLMGKLGSGKTTALLDLTLRLCRGEFSDQNNLAILPLYVHCAQLQIPSASDQDTLEVFIQASKHLFSKQIQRRLSKYFHNLAKNKSLIILLDGLDELPPPVADQVILFTSRFQQQYPQLRMIVSASVNYIGDLINGGFVPIGIKSWNSKDVHTFLEKWRNAWIKSSHSESKPTTENLILINSWILQVFQLLTPLEWVLATWLMYNGNLLNGTPISILDNGVKLIKQTSKSTDELAKIYLDQLLNDSLETKNYRGKGFIETAKPTQKFQSATPSLSTLEVHPLLRCFLAAQEFQPSDQNYGSLANPHWALGLQTFIFALAKQEQLVNSQIVEKYHLFTESLIKALALKYMRTNSEGTQTILRECAKILSSPNLSLNLRSKFLITIASSPVVDTKSVIEFLLRSKDPTLLHLGALGFGLLPQATSIELLMPLLENPIPNVFIAASNALAVNGSSKSIDALTNSLVNGHERLQIAAAQALAIHPQQGQAILAEAIHHDNPSVRKACVYGLVRVNQPWCYELLEKLAIEDSHWMVKDSASSALEFLNSPNTWIPNSPSPLAELNWLIQFAASRGLGVSPSGNEEELILLALKEGNIDQKISAIEAILFHPFETAIPELLSLMTPSGSELKEYLYLTVWFISISNLST